VKRAAIAIGTVAVLAAGVAVWALTRSGGDHGPRAANPARVQRGADQQKGTPDGPSTSAQAPEGGDGATAQGRGSDRDKRRDQAGPADGEKNRGPAAPGDDHGDRRPPSEMSDVERARTREQMLARMLDQAGLTDKGKTAARNAMEAKHGARQALSEKLTDLRRIANKSHPTDKELRDALTAYRAAVVLYRKKVEAADRSLERQLSVRAQARCLCLGILDNGLGGFGRGGPGANRPAR
jgi:hypothetical protein